ncbi:MAG TPA: ArsC/Spx/MgsR family protein [Gemmatimonadaceae bacterium]|nr:ArsC/Spx/MgsR family protein [Gemmatimonadaceae bacterium]
MRAGQPPRRAKRCLVRHRGAGRFDACCARRSLRARSAISGERRVEVQVFGTQKNQDTRRALRFWAERRVKVHFVDLTQRAASKGELQRFTQKFGLTALIDKTSKRYAALGLGVARYSDEKWMDILTNEPLVLAQPLCRWGGKLTIGLAEDDWKAWVAAERTA